MASFFSGGNCGGKYFFYLYFIQLFHSNKYNSSINMYKAGKGQGQGGYPSGIAKVLVGALALGLGEFLGSGSATLFGSDQTSGLGELGIK